MEIFQYFINMSIFELVVSIIVFFPLFIFLITSLFNSFLGPYINFKGNYNENDLVSLLVPARNEEKNIKTVIESLSKQSHKSLEIILLDDNSTDQTYSIAKEYEKYDNFKIIKGKKLPEGWLGKNWACKQLTENAKGKYLIFTDADNFHDKDAVKNTISMMNKYNLNLLSAFPQQIMKTIPEKIIVPLIDMIIYSGLPLWLTYYIKSPLFAAANGQWMAFRADDYHKMNIHESVKDEIVEDVEISRLMKRNSLKILTCSGKNMVYSRMYSNFNEIWHGLSKNLFGLTDFKTIPFFVLLSILFMTSLLPLILLFSNTLFLFALSIIVLNILWRFILAVNYKHDILISIFLYPLTILSIIVIGINSFYQSKFGNVQWKQRKIKLNR